MNRNELMNMARYLAGQGYDFCPLFMIEIEPFEGDYIKVTFEDIESFLNKRSNPEPLLPPSDEEHIRRLALIRL